VRGVRTDDAAVSVRTPRGARARPPRSVLEVRAGLTQAVLTRGLLGVVVVQRRTMAVRRRRVGERAWRQAGAFPPLVHGMCPCFLTRFS
jgi:hypothetical protein